MQIYFWYNIYFILVNINKIDVVNPIIQQLTFFLERIGKELAKNLIYCIEYINDFVNELYTCLIIKQLYLIFINSEDFVGKFDLIAEQKRGL